MNARRIMALSPIVEVGIRNLYWRSPVLPNLVTRLKARRKKPAGTPAAEASTSIDRIVQLLREWGVGEGDLLVVHSGYRAIRGGGASPDAVLDALLELVGPTGTLVMPAIPSWPEAPKLYDRMVADVSDLVLDYDPAVTPAWTGAVPSAMMKRPNAHRSLHPLNSVVAIGSLAEAMLEGNLSGDRPFPNGPTSSWNFLYRNNAKVVAMGADLAHSLTMIHLAEDLQGEDWPVEGWYRDRKFRIKVNGAFELHTVRERHPKWAMYYGERTLSKDLIETGICRQRDVDGVNVELISGAEMINYLKSRNHTRYPYFLIPRASKKPVRRAPAKRLEHERSLRGFHVLCAGTAEALLSRRSSLFSYNYQSHALQPICDLPHERDLKSRIAGIHPWLRRAARVGIMVGCEESPGTYIVAARRGIYAVDRAAGSARLLKRLPPDARALQFAKIEGIAGFDDGLYYGDYGGNADMRPMSIWRKSFGEDEWRAVFQFPRGEINHIHALVADPHRNCVWILTGDYGHAAGIWRARDHFATVEPVCRGQQIFRACNGFPTADGLLYATDSHLYPNSIRILREHDGQWRSTALHPLVGSSIHACRVGSSYAFSTAAEPGQPSGRAVVDILDPRLGPGIVDDVCEVVVGTPEQGFETVIRWKVDRLPKRLFGFSNIRLPSISGEPARFIASGSGVRGHHDVTEVFNLHDRQK